MNFLQNRNKLDRSQNQTYNYQRGYMWEGGKLGDWD